MNRLCVILREVPLDVVSVSVVRVLNLKLLGLPSLTILVLLIGDPMVIVEPATDVHVDLLDVVGVLREIERCTHLHVT